MRLIVNHRKKNKPFINMENPHEQVQNALLSRVINNMVCE